MLFTLKYAVFFKMKFFLLLAKRNLNYIEEMTHFKYLFRVYQRVKTLIREIKCR